MSEAAIYFAWAAVVSVLLGDYGMEALTDWRFWVLSSISLIVVILGKAMAGSRR